MNPKITKLRAERAKNAEKIGRLTARNDEIDQEITKLENLDIVGLVRGLGMTPDQLAALLRANPIIPAAAVEQKEDTPHEEM